ncbi:hypothetical protein V865_000508 [Kwoniella europaea PYCC6329]|uniref:Zinc finger PHD-type domain-containing protein n=1 Tax=Kwoniella europaea PYCC6329 TaxID=1423913 RepID=A0AAX4KAE4_9TREE
MPAPVMSQLENTSAILGEYMLKGWTLTDLHCSSCRVTPLMREPNASAEREGRERTQFCALCDGRPEGRLPTSSSSITQPQNPIASSSNSDNQPREEIQTREEEKQPSQSDEAALSISELLLKGYSLLGDNCPNPACKGIPLVGYPRKSDGSKDPRRMCVSCGSRWIDEKEIEKEGMTVMNSRDQVESPRTKARNELYGLDGKGKQKEKEQQQEVKVDRKAFERQARESAQRLERGVEDEVEGEDVDMEEEGVRDSQPALMKSSLASTRPLPHPLPRPINQPVPPSPSSPLGKALSSTSDSLSSTLQNLSSSLERYAAHPPGQRRNGEDESGKWFVDLKLHTEAIKDVLGVLGQVERAKRVGY